MFKRMERWTMTFWALAPRTVTKYLSFENQGRDSCKQTILPSELLFKFCESRNKFITWDAKHIRWACMTDAEQVWHVRMSCVWTATESDRWPDVTFLCFWQIESVPPSYFLYYQASWHCTACLELPWSWKLLPHRQAFLQCLQLFNSLGCHCLQFFTLSWAHTWFESGHRTVLIKFSLWQSTKFRTFVWDSLRGSDSIHYCVLEVFQTVTCQKALFVQNITLVHIRRLQVHVHHFPTFAKKSQQKYHIWG